MRPRRRYAAIPLPPESTAVAAPAPETCRDIDPCARSHDERDSTARAKVERGAGLATVDAHTTDHGDQGRDIPAPRPPYATATRPCSATPTHPEQPRRRHQQLATPQHVARSSDTGSAKRVARLALAHPRLATPLHCPDAPREGSPSGTMQHPVKWTGPGGQYTLQDSGRTIGAKGPSHQQHNRAQTCSTVEGGP